jgi:hypothetical protein
VSWTTVREFFPFHLKEELLPLPLLFIHPLAAAADFVALLLRQPA